MTKPTKDLDEDEFYRLLDEHYKNQPQYRSIDQIKEAVGEMEAIPYPILFDNAQNIRIIVRNQLRKEVLQSLNLEGEEDE